MRQRLLQWLDGRQDMQWVRIVKMREVKKLLDSLPLRDMTVLEISGLMGTTMNFRSYKMVEFPEFDICENVLPDRYDLIIAEEIFEHLLWPYKAGKNVLEMLAPGGYFLITTPFLVSIHNAPADCTRWTETGLKYFLAECGFPQKSIQTGSWGNRKCVKANFIRFVEFKARFHSLKNEERYPVAVWALARKDVFGA